MNKTQVKNQFRKYSMWEDGQGSSWKEWDDEMSRVAAAPEGPSILGSDSPLSQLHSVLDPTNGPSPPSPLASATYRITEKRVHSDEVLSWDLVCLPLFLQVRNPTSPRTLRSRSHQVGPSLVSQTLVAYLVTAQWLTGLHPKNLISQGLAILGFEKPASCLEPPRLGTRRRARGQRAVAEELSSRRYTSLIVHPPLSSRRRGRVLKGASSWEL